MKSQPSPTEITSGAKESDNRHGPHALKDRGQEVTAKLREQFGTSRMLELDIQMLIDSHAWIEDATIGALTHDFSKNPLQGPRPNDYTSELQVLHTCAPDPSQLRIETADLILDGLRPRAVTETELLLASVKRALSGTSNSNPREIIGGILKFPIAHRHSGMIDRLAAQGIPIEWDQSAVAQSASTYLERQLLESISLLDQTRETLVDVYRYLNPTRNLPERARDVNLSTHLAMMRVVDHYASLLNKIVRRVHGFSEGTYLGDREFLLDATPGLLGLLDTHTEAYRLQSSQLAEDMTEQAITSLYECGFFYEHGDDGEYIDGSQTEAEDRVNAEIAKLRSEGKTNGQIKAHFRQRVEDCVSDEETQAEVYLDMQLANSVLAKKQDFIE